MDVLLTKGKHSHHYYTNAKQKSQLRHTYKHSTPESLRMERISLWWFGSVYFSFSNEIFADAMFVYQGRFQKNNHPEASHLNVASLINARVVCH